MSHKTRSRLSCLPSLLLPLLIMRPLQTACSRQRCVTPSAGYHAPPALPVITPDPPCAPRFPATQEITRRVNLHDIWQAAYTAGVVLPKPVSVCRYYHRSLNPKKLIDVGFSSLNVSLHGAHVEGGQEGVCVHGLRACMCVRLCDCV